MTGLGDPRIDLAARQLTALTGLGALCHLDLDLARIDQILAGHTEATGSHLLDRRVLRIAIGQWLESLGILTTLAGVALAAKAIHRNGERLVSFLADGAIAHRAGLEALDQALNRLDLIQRHRTAVRLELEQAAQRGEVLGLIVDQLRIGLVDAVVVCAHRLLQAVDRLGIEQVVLATSTPLILTARFEYGLFRITLGKGRVMTLQHFLRNDIDANTAHARRRPREVFVDEILTQADRFEDLGTVVALHRGDAHLGHHFDDALGSGLNVVLASELVIDVDQQAVADHAIHSLEGHVGVDGIAAVTDQQREVMHLTRITGLQHQADAGT